MLLAVKDLSVRYGKAQVVEGVSFELERGEALGMVGESGSGKSTVARAVLRLLPRHARVGGSVRLDDRDLLNLPQSELRRLRWRQISAVFQSTMSALTPVYRLDDQIAEAICIHRPMARKEALRRAGELLERTGIQAGFGRFYPHQLSGGMRQRACIAMAMALDPDLVVADEPTTALDVLTQSLVLEALARLRAEGNRSLLLISHDLAVVTQTCDRILVLYAGRVAEVGPVRDIHRNPMHPYTMGLLHAVQSDDALVAIPGTLPSRDEPIVGCVFAPRCPFARAICEREAPSLVEVAPGHHAACHFIDEAANFRERAADPATWGEA